MHPTLTVLQIAQATSSLIESIVSVKRLSTFFQADELQTDARTIVVKEELQEGDEVSTASI
jgi:ATP-binding cassette subfamily C (CFTR/MRP) protein 1